VGTLLAVRQEPGPVEITVDGDTARAVLSGEFDMRATFTVEPALARVLEEPGLRRLVVDLSRLSFIDSTGIGVLLRVQQESAARGIELVLVPGPDHVHRVFETTGLAGSLPFVSGA
jgi:anti-sigma B factor antagonist